MRKFAGMAGYAALALIAAFFVFGYLVAFDQYWFKEIEWMALVVAAWYVGRLLTRLRWRTHTGDGGGR
ncbi:MAG: hypothetical protein ACREQX_04890 [Candidatus Binataceae bacterium]